MKGILSIVGEDCKIVGGNVADEGLSGQCELLLTKNCTIIKAQYTQ